MQGDSQCVVPLKDVEKWQITVLVGLLENAVEIADRLMIVKHEHKAKWVSHSGLGVTAAWDEASSNLELP